MVRCGYCEETLQPEGNYVKCNGCENHYCFGCSVRETTYRTMTEEKRMAWRCQHKCKGKSSSTSTSKSVLQTLENVDITSNNDPEIKVMIINLTKKIEGFETILRDVKDSQHFISNQYDTMLSEIKELKKQNQNLKDEIVGLKRKVSDRDAEIDELKIQINEMDQYNRRYNMEICGVQNAGKEDTMKILEKISEEIEVPFNDQLIQAAHPLKQYNPNYPPTIMVQFTRKDVRDQWIAQGRKTYRNAPAGKTKVYFNENLTVANRKLHRDARIKAKDKNFKFVWVKNGKVFVKKNEEASVIHIKSTKDLDKM